MNYSYYTAKIDDKFLSPYFVSGYKLIDLNLIYNNIAIKKISFNKNFNKFYNIILSKFSNNHQFNENNKIEKIKNFDCELNFIKKNNRKNEIENNLSFLNLLHCLYILKRLDENFVNEKFKNLKIIKILKKEDNNNLIIEEKSYLFYLDFFSKILEKYLVLPYFLDSYSKLINDHGYFICYKNLCKLKNNLKYFNPSEKDIKYLDTLLKKSKKKEENHDIFVELYNRSIYTILSLKNFFQDEKNLDFNFCYGINFYTYNLTDKENINEIINFYENLVTCDERNCRIVSVHRNKNFRDIEIFSFLILMKDPNNLVNLMKTIGLYELGYGTKIGENLQMNNGNKRVYTISSFYDLCFTKELLKIFYI